MTPRSGLSNTIKHLRYAKKGRPKPPFPALMRRLIVVVFFLVRLLRRI
jgi:hypothetical protein